MSYRLLAALALIVVHSIYIGQVVRTSTTPLVMHAGEGYGLCTVMSVPCNGWKELTALPSQLCLSEDSVYPVLQRHV